MDQRVAFIADWLRDDWTMTELAERYGISRKTGYKWVDRYAADPEQGLGERSRAPKVHGRAMADDVREALIEHGRAPTLCLRFSVGVENPGDGPLRLILEGSSCFGDLAVTQRILQTDGTWINHSAGVARQDVSHFHNHYENGWNWTLFRVGDPVSETLRIGDFVDAGGAGVPGIRSWSRPQARRRICRSLSWLRRACASGRRTQRTSSTS